MFPSTRFQEAAELNNEGIAALQTGDYERAATELFPRAIQILKAELLNVTPSNTDTYRIQHNPQDIELLQDHTHTVEIDASYFSSSKTEDSRDYYDHGVVFRRAILMPTDADILDQVQVYEFCLHMYTTVAIYNLALAYHIMTFTKSFEDDDDDDEAIHKVEKLYEIILKLYMDGSSLLNMRTGLIIKLACINNLSFIRYYQQGYECCWDDEHERSRTLSSSQRSRKNSKQELLQHIAYFMRRSDSSNQALFEDLVEQEGADNLQRLLHNAILLLHDDISPGLRASRQLAAAA